MGFAIQLSLQKFRNKSN